MINKVYSEQLDTFHSNSIQFEHRTTKKNNRVNDEQGSTANSQICFIAIPYSLNIEQQKRIIE